jgi:4'-phosphopantetheinyl transferase EntD
MRGSDCEVMNEAATAVMPTQNRCYDGLIIHRDEAESGIALEKSRDIVDRIGATQPHTLHRLPQAARLSVVFGAKHANFEAHFRQISHASTFKPSVVIRSVSSRLNHEQQCHPPPLRR